jgi:hypothetical protein
MPKSFIFLLLLFLYSHFHLQYGSYPASLIPSNTNNPTLLSYQSQVISLCFETKINSNPSQVKYSRSNVSPLERMANWCLGERSQTPKS